MNEPEEQMELFEDYEDYDDFAFDDDYVHDEYLIESDAEALASAGFGTDEDYNHFDAWDDEAGYRY